MKDRVDKMQDNERETVDKKRNKKEQQPLPYKRHTVDETEVRLAWASPLFSYGALLS